MANSQNTTSRRTIWMCGLSIILCLAMFIGTTLAWFSDTVSNKGNRIQAGDLKIGFYATENADLAVNNTTGVTTDWRNLKSDTAPVFVFANPAQPGDQLVRYIMIKNEGSIALKYFLDFVVEDGGLGDAVQVDLERIQPSPVDPDRYPAATYTAKQMADLKINGSSSNNGDYMIYKMTMRFDASAGNTYQSGKISMDINLTATQNKDGAIAGLTRVTTVDEINAAPANASIILMKDISEADRNVDLKDFANIDLNGYTLTCGNFSLVQNDKIGTIDVANGTINAKDIHISAEKGTLNLNNLNGISASGKVFLNGSMSTVNLRGSTSFNAPITVPADTRVVIDSSVVKPFAIIVEGGNVIIENNSIAAGNTVTIADSVSGSVEIKNEGVIAKVDNQSASSDITVGGNAPDESAGNVDTSGVSYYNASYGDWKTDRTEPQSFSAADGIINMDTKTEPNNNWYAWQGRKAAVSMNTVSGSWSVETSLYVDTSNERAGTRKTAWLNIVDAYGSTVDWAVVGYKVEANGTKTWQSFDASESTGTSWKDAAGVSTVNGWNTVKFEVVGNTMKQYVNGTLANQYDIDAATSTAVKEVIFNSYSYGESYNTQWKLPHIKYESLISKTAAGANPNFNNFQAFAFKTASEMYLEKGTELSMKYQYSEDGGATWADVTRTNGSAYVKTPLLYDGMLTINGVKETSRTKITLPKDAAVVGNDSSVASRIGGLVDKIKATSGSANIKVRTIMSIEQNGHTTAFGFPVVTYSDGGASVSPRGLPSVQ